MSGCEEVREILMAQARGEATSAPGAKFLGEHVEQCPDCRRRLANERMLSAGLAAMAAVAPLAPPPAIKEALLVEFRRQKLAAPIRPVSGWRKPAWIGIAALAAALVAAVWFVPRAPRAAPAPDRRPAAMARNSGVGVQPPAAPASAGVAEAAARPDVPAGAKRRVAASHGRPVRGPKVQAASKPRLAPAPAEDAPEVATDFFEIPYVEPLRPDQRADVFRVQMPRAGMAVFGLPVVGGRLDSRVTADVLMTEDGIVRAVRFIR